MPSFLSGDQSIHYDDMGEGRLVIATHGMMSPGYWALSGVAGVMGLKRRLVAPDLRGHGRTRAAHGYDVETMASDIGALADHLGYKRFHLIGHATGGMVALRYAMRHSDRLDSLIVMDTSARTTPLPPDHFEMQAKLIENTRPEDIYAVVNETPAAIFQSGLDVIPNAGEAKAMVAAMFAANEPAKAGQFMRRYFSDPDMHERLLRGISCPAFCIVGEHDQPFHADIKFIADNIPDAEHLIIAGIGHHCAIESPWRTVTMLEDFLDRAESGQAKGRTP